MKKIFWGLFFTIIISALTFCALGEVSGTIDDRITWVLDDEGVLTISGTGALPQIYDLSSQKDQIKSVIINDGIASLGNSCFSDLTNVVSIQIPESVTNIGSSAFGSCSRLSSISLPDRLISIAQYAFYNCDALTAVKIPDGVTVISNNLFYSCDNLTTVILPESTLSIGSYAFYNCEKLTGVAIPDQVESIGESAFSGCKGMTGSLVIPAQVKSIGECAFEKCENLSRIVLPDGLKSIPAYLFSQCTNLVSVNIPDSVNSIGQRAFSLCKNLKTITIPDGVENLSEGILYYCESLTEVNIPDNLTGIGSNAFGRCSNLTHIDIPNTVKQIGDGAFYDCKKLENINLPSGLEAIETETFYGCSSLSEITIPDGVERIGQATFGSCKRLKTIDIPNSVKEIGSFAFCFDSALKSVTLPSGITKIPDNTFLNCSCLTTIVIPGNVTEIGTGAFLQCSSLKNVTIPGSVISIGEEAFQRCNLSSITLPESVSAVGDSAFLENNNITKITILGEKISLGSTMFTPLNVTVYCYQDSDAVTWAENNGYTITYLDSLSSSDVHVVLPETITLGCGCSKDLKPQIWPTGDATSIQWTVSPTGIVEVSNGVVTALSKGKATVSATIGENTTNMTVTTYIPAQEITLEYEESYGMAESNIPLPSYTTQPAGSEAHLTWDFDITSRTALSYSYGKSGIYSSGEADFHITGTSEEGVSTSCVIHVVYPVTAVDLGADMNLATGTDHQLTANVTMREQHCVNHLVTFSSSNETIATVSQTGLVRALSEGDVTITATAESGKFDSMVIHVTTVCTEHTYVTDPAVAATCTHTGLTEGSHCSVCGYVNIPQEVIPVADHIWGDPVYTWSADHTSVTAVRTCENSEEHTESETVSTVLKETQLICEQPKKDIYISGRFSNTAFARQTKEVTYGGTVSHIWGPAVYEWSADNSSVTASLVCIRNSAHKTEETAEVTSRVTKAATCTQTGETTYTSAAFTNTAFSVQTKTLADIPAKDHKLSHHPAVNAGCTTSGNGEYWSCDTCGKLFLDENASQKINSVPTISAAGHLMNGHARIAPTCTEAGTEAYWECSACHNLYSDSLGYYQITSPSVIPATGHAWDAPIYVWSADNSRALAIRFCTNNTSHQERETADAVSEVTKEPTADEYGETTYTVTFTNPAFGTIQKTEADIPKEDPDWNAPAYTWSEDYSQVTAKRVHRTDPSREETETVETTGKVTREATCTEKGETTYTSEAFTNQAFVVQVKAVENIQAKGHALIPHGRKDPTCTEDGYEAYWCCDNCRHLFSDAEGKNQINSPVSIAAPGHEVVVDAAVTPTCTKAGKTEGRHCSRCGEVLTAQGEIPAPGHAVVVDSPVAATCTTAGKTEGRHCSRCGEVLLAQGEIPALGHSEVLDPAVAPTCTAAGKTEGKHCNRCGEVLTAQTEVPALGHDVVIDPAIAPTCTAVGKTEGLHCSRCGEVMETQAEVPALGHDVVIDPAVAPTCTAAGKTEGKHCSRCNEVLVAQTEVAALGHDVVIDPAVAPTCTTAGKTEGKHCGRCGEVLTAQTEVPAQGHTLTAHARVEPTGTAEGTEAYWSCDVCKKLFSDAEGKNEIEKPVVIKELTPDQKITAFVNRCYSLILNRGADPEGLKTWVANLKNKTQTASEIIYGFMYSGEFTNRNLSNEEAVEILYLSMLNRGSDPAGKATWTENLNNGSEYVDIINGFCNSGEFIGLCADYGIEPGSVPGKEEEEEDPDKVQAFVRRCYKLILNRGADEAGLKDWTNALKEGTRTASEIIYGFMYSGEYTSRNMSNEDTVEILYKTMLNRGSDPSGKAGWLDRLSKGQTVVHIINGFCGSGEFIGLCESYGIEPGSVKTEEAAVLDKTNGAEKKTAENEPDPIDVNESTDETETAETLLGEAVQESVMNEEKAKEFVSRCYKAALDREANETELTGWVNQIATGAKSPDRIVRGFLFSEEFRARNLSSEEIVKILYRIYMNREADPEGLAFWTAKLEVGMTLEDMVKGFAASDEFKAILRDMKK